VIIGVCVCVYSGAGIKIYYKVHIVMSLSESRKLLQQSRKVVEEADENTSVTSILNMILNLVSSIDKRLQSAGPQSATAFLFFSQTVFKLSNKFPTPWIPLSTSVILR
jgi:hypothetical protein